MEVKNKFEVKREGDKVLVVQTITKTMDAKESLMQLNQLRGEASQIMRKQQELKKAMDDNKPQKDLKALDENVEQLRVLEKDWKKAIEPDHEKLSQELRAKIKVAKANKGYNRLAKGDARIIVSNNILGPIAAEMNLEMNHPLIMEAKAKFDEI